MAKIKQNKLKTQKTKTTLKPSINIQNRHTHTQAN